MVSFKKFKNLIIQKFIIKDGKYFSGMFGKIKRIFLERMAYKNFYMKKIFI